MLLSCESYPFDVQKVPFWSAKPMLLTHSFCFLVLLTTSNAGVFNDVESARLLSFFTFFLVKDWPHGLSFAPETIFSLYLLTKNLIDKLKNKPNN